MISMVMDDRIKEIILMIVSKERGGFIKGRIFLNEITMARKSINSMQR